MNATAFDTRLSHVRKLFPGRPSTTTLNRFCAKGVRGPGGQRVVLASMKVGGVRYTSAAAVHQFLGALNPPRHDEAEAELVNDGC